MEKEIYICNLFDTYEKLLTEKQKMYFKEYYFENLSMQEIADNYNVSKNAVSKSINETEKILLNYEDVIKKHNLILEINNLIERIDNKELVNKLNIIVEKSLK